MRTWPIDNINYVLPLTQFKDRIIGKPLYSNFLFFILPNAEAQTKKLKSKPTKPTNGLSKTKIFGQFICILY